jgi:RNase P/RNase MRP subunit POP5
MNRRYLLLNANSKEDVEKAILEYIGILGWAKAAPMFLKSNSHLVLAVDRKELADIRSAFELSNREIKILKVSGTIKGLGKQNL